MIISVLIITISVGLFAYWFRYTCLLILNTKTSTDYSSEVALANHMSFAAAQQELSGAGKLRLSSIERSLDRDYALISSLLEQTLGAEEEGGQLEQAMLKLDFIAMKMLFRVSSPVSQSFARSAVREMSQVVAHLANSLGELRHAGAQAS